jgi:ribosomal protein S12 methylthiotransferase accessory factor
MWPLSSDNFSPALSTILSATFGKTHGLVTAVDEQLPDRRAGGIRITQATMPAPSYFRANRFSAVSTALVGTGAAFSRESACWSAVGETLERYCASIYDAGQLIEASAEGLGASALELSTLIHCGRRDVQHFKPDDRRMWVEGRNLVSGTVCWVPAAMCYLGYEKRWAEECLGQNDSSGLAFARTFEDATHRALCEVIERDVFASSWHLNRRPRRIEFDRSDHPKLDPSVATALKNQSPALTLAHMDCVFGVHVVMGVAMGPRGHGVVSAAASTCVIQAIEKATAEALHGWHFARTLNVQHLGLGDLKRPSDHLYYYLPPDRFSHVHDFCHQGHTVRFQDLVGREITSPSLTSIGASLQQAGYEAAVVDVTTPDIAALGYRVARVVVPGLQPLIFGADCTKVPDQRRLDWWRQKWGLEGQGLNPMPHPFP